MNRAKNWKVERPGEVAWYRNTKIGKEVFILNKGQKFEVWKRDIMTKKETFIAEYSRASSAKKRLIKLTYELNEEFN